MAYRYNKQQTSNASQNANESVCTLSGDKMEEQIDNLACETDRLKGLPASTHTKVVVTPKFLATQHTTTKVAGADLFSKLPKSIRKEAILYNKDDLLLTNLIDGIDGTSLSYKVILALIMQLYEHSEEYGGKGNTTGKEKALVGAPDGLFQPLTESGVLRLSPIYPVSIYFTVADFTKRTLAKRRITGQEENDVASALLELTKKFIYVNAGGQPIATKLIGDYIPLPARKGDGTYIVLSLNSIFCSDVHNYVQIRKDTLILLRGNQKTITWRLFWYLIEKMSYRVTNGKAKWKNIKMESVSINKLFERIAIKKRYNDHQTERRKDFEEAIQKMVVAKIIKPIVMDKNDPKKYDQEKSGYYQTIGADGHIICHFRFNQNYTTEDIETERSCASPSPKMLCENRAEK